MILNKRGFGLIEVMVAAGIMSVIGLGAMQMLGTFQKGANDLRATQNRDYIAQIVRDLAGNPSALNISAGNQLGAPFARCVGKSGATANCSALASPAAIRLYSPSNVLVADGTAAGPVVYAVDGSICGTGAGVVTERCAFEVRAWYAPDCTNSCVAGGVASSVKIFYEIKKSAAVAKGLVYKTVCTFDSLTMRSPGCPAGAGVPSVGVITPLFYNSSGTATKLAFWSNSDQLSGSNVAQDGTGNVFLNKGNGATSSCSNASHLGSVRTNSATGALESCISNGGVYTWRWFAGSNASSAGTNAQTVVADSGAFKVPGKARLPGFYLCPIGGNTSRCGGDPACIGQVSRVNYCCMDKAIVYGDGGFGTPITLGTNAAPGVCQALF